MKKTVILSTNDNPDYLSYLSYVQKAWNKLGWDTLTFYLGKKRLISTFTNIIIEIPSIPEYKDCTVVQVARLFGHKFIDGLIMTGDVDMIPMSNYWNPDPNEITCYGIDLTGDNQIPMCYVAAYYESWKKIIPETNIRDLLEKYPKARSDDFQDYWFVDQNILTERIGEMDYKSISRGLSGNLAYGRIDRADWEYTINNSDKKIDAHMPRPFNKEQTERIMNLITI